LLQLLLSFPGFSGHQAYVAVDGLQWSIVSAPVGCAGKKLPMHFGLCMGSFHLER
jgi:predicted heme/steroid binding protein